MLVLVLTFQYFRAHLLSLQKVFVFYTSLARVAPFLQLLCKCRRSKCLKQYWSMTICLVQTKLVAIAEACAPLQQLLLLAALVLKGIFVQMIC